MTSYRAMLSEARAETIPQMADLLPEMGGDRRIILDTLKTNFAALGGDPEEVRRADWNKAERYTMVGHLIIQQSDALVEGHGSEAHFRDFRVGPSAKRTKKDFRKSLYYTQAAGARQVEDSYRGSGAFSRNPYKIAAGRYRRLGMRAFLTDGLIRSAGGGKLWVKPGAALEGMSLSVGMRTSALRSAITLHMNAMQNVTKDVSEKDMPKDERLQAAHDLAYMPIGITAMHLVDVADRIFRVPSFKAVKDGQTGRYRAVYDNPDDSRKLYEARFADLPSERHKCPAHVRLRDPETGCRMDSALQNMFHAGINAGVEFGYYDL